MTTTGDRETAEDALVQGKARTRKFAARRAAIVASAVEAINQRGVRGMTLADVAARLDLVPTGVIYYFRNKEALAAAVFLDAIGAYEALLTQAENAPTGPQRVSAFVHGYFDLRSRIAAGQAEPIAIFSDLRALHCAEADAAYEDMYRHVRRLISDGPSTSPGALNARTLLLLSQINWTVAWLGQWEVDDFPRIADRMTSVLVGGLAGPGVTWAEIAAPAPAEAAAAEGDLAPSELFLRAATELINQEGYHGASVDRISARLHVTKGAFYHHNATKDELVEACFQRTFDLMWSAVREADACGGSGLVRFVRLATALMRLQTGGTPLLRTSSLATVPEAIATRLRQRLDRITLRYSSMICDGISDGSIRPVDAAIAARMITAAMNSAPDLRYWKPHDGEIDPIEHFVRPMIVGLFPGQG